MWQSCASTLDQSIGKYSTWIFPSLKQSITVGETKTKDRLLLQLHLLSPANNKSRKEQQIFITSAGIYSTTSTGSISNRSVCHYQLHLLQDCWFHLHSLQSKSKNTFIIHLLNLPPTLSCPKTLSHSYTLAWILIGYQTQVISKLWKLLACFMFPDMIKSWVLRWTSFIFFVVMSLRLLFNTVWFSSESCSVGAVIALSAALCWSIRV